MLMPNQKKKLNMMKKSNKRSYNIITVFNEALENSMSILHSQLLLIILSLLIVMMFCFQMGCDNLGTSKSYYKELYRPQFHFTPEKNWMNDHNGLVFFEGEYHLFYQYNPFGINWGHMSWGHAVSEDLVHWDHLPVALNEEDGIMIFSGSAVVDWKNKSRFGRNGQPPLVAIYTGHRSSNQNQSQCIAYSNYEGRSWTKYKGNPVLQNPGTKDFRDPKVIWYEETNKWIMSLAVGNYVNFYSSPDLKKWEFESEFGSGEGAHGGVWECPDLFPLRINGENTQKWVLLVSMNPGGPNGGSATQYFVGDFNGHKFTNELKQIRWIDYGKDNYAGVTWSDIPDEDGRRIFIGWMNNWQYAQTVPTNPWRSSQTIPRELELKTYSEGIWICLLYTSPSPRDLSTSRMPSSA